MTDTPETIFRIIIPNKSGTDEKSQELLKNLASVSDKDIKIIGEEIENREKDKESKGNKNVEESSNETGEILSQNLDGDFRVICDVDGNNVEYDSTRGIMRWKGKDYNVNTFGGVRIFLDEMMKAGIDQNTLLAISAEIGI